MVDKPSCTDSTEPSMQVSFFTVGAQGFHTQGQAVMGIHGHGRRVSVSDGSATIEELDDCA